MVLSVGWVGSIRWKSGMSNPFVAWILMSQVVDYSITNKIAILSATDADSNMYHPPLFGTIWVYWIYSCLGWWLFANDSLLGSFVALGLRSSSLSSSSSSSSLSSSSSSSSYHVGLAMAQYLLVNSQRTHVSYYGFMHCTYPEKLYVFKLLNHVYICINMYVCFYIYIYIYIYICMYPRSQEAISNEVVRVKAIYQTYHVKGHFARRHCFFHRYMHHRSSPDQLLIGKLPFSAWDNHGIQRKSCHGHPWTARSDKKHKVQVK